MGAVYWPGTLVPSSVLFHPNIPSASGGPSITGSEQIVFSSAGRWRAKINLKVVSSQSRKKLLSARALLAHLKGRSNTVFVPVYDDSNAPSPLAGGQSGYLIEPHDDGSFFNDGAGYSLPTSRASLISGVSAGSMSIAVGMLDSSQEPQAGQYFGFGNSELYLIDTSIQNSDGTWTLTFWPTLRNDHATTEEPNFTHPTCEMRLLSDDSGELSLEAMYVGEQTLEFIEAV